MPSIFFNNQPVIDVRDDWLKILKQEAKKSSTGRARLCLHRSPEDTVQEMIIAFHRSSLVAPHRHPGKSESFHMVEGELVVVLLDDGGNIEQTINMAPPGSSHAFVYRLSESKWHIVIPLSEFAVVHEVSSGPFRAGDAELPDWAPVSETELRALNRQILSSR